MELRHLRDFVAVAEDASFTRAAARLHVAQPSLTRQLKNLEEELGVRLLNRSNAGVSLTEEGHAFLLSAKRVLALSTESVEALQRMNSRKPPPQLNIGYIASLHCDLVTHTLTQFRRAHPHVGFNLFDMMTGEQLSALQEYTLDVGFIAPDRNMGGTTLQVECVARHDVLVALPQNHALCRKPKLGRGDLKACFVVALSEKCWPGWRSCMNQILCDSALDLQILQEAENEAAVLKLVGLGLGIAFVPEPMKRIPHAGVGFRPLQPALRISSSMVWRHGNESTYLEQYIHIVRQTAAASSELR
jgi:DNA-binding transcriptional LysR family regulator